VGEVVHYARQNKDCNASLLNTTGWGSLTSVADEDLIRLYVAFINQTPLEDWVKLCYYSTSDGCHDCGEPLEVVTNGMQIKFLNPCKYPNGIGSFTTTIEITSGKIVFANDLRKHFPEPKGTKVAHSLCTIAGLMEEAQDYETVGLGYGFCTADIDILRSGDNFLLSGCEVENTQKVGEIITDLWWYSIADYDLATKRKTKLPKSAFVFEVPNGKYEITHYGHINCDNYDRIYAEIKYVS